MSFFNTMGQAALLLTVYRWITGKSRQQSYYSDSYYDRLAQTENQARIRELEAKIALIKRDIARCNRFLASCPAKPDLGCDVNDIDAVAARIGQLEKELACCDNMSPCYLGIEKDLLMLRQQYNRLEEGYVPEPSEDPSMENGAAYLDIEDDDDSLPEDRKDEDDLYGIEEYPDIGDLSDVDYDCDIDGYGYPDGDGECFGDEDKY